MSAPNEHRCKKNAVARAQLLLNTAPLQLKRRAAKLTANRLAGQVQASLHSHVARLRFLGSFRFALATLRWLHGHLVLGTHVLLGMALCSDAVPHPLQQKGVPQRGRRFCHASPVN